MPPIKNAWVRSIGLAGVLCLGLSPAHTVREPSPSMPILGLGSSADKR